MNSIGIAGTHTWMSQYRSRSRLNEHEPLCSRADQEAYRLNTALAVD